MKKSHLFLCFLLILLVLTGCQTQPQVTTAPPPVVTTEAPTTEPVTEPTTEAPLPNLNTDLLGIDLRGMDYEQALQTVTDTLQCYQLKITVNKTQFTFSAQQLSLCVSEEAFRNWYLADQVLEPAGIILYDISGAAQTIEQQLTEGVRDAKIEYSSNAGCFVVTSERTGTSVEIAPALETLDLAVSSLSPTASVTLKTTHMPPKVFHNDPRIQPALDAANSYLTLQLSYVFEAPGVKTATVKLSKATLAEFISINKDFEVSINTDAVATYITVLAGKHGGDKTKGNFIATSGRTVNLTVEYYGAVLDQSATYTDLLYCLENKVSDTRYATYLSAETASMPYGGNYVEVDMINQMLWLYKDGKLVVSTPVVTGNLSSGARTPTGVYTVYEKKTDCWLTGKTFRDFVNYWVAFNGNIGMHDASWRQDFGGEIHKYTGSHGCVNMPPAVAGTVYNNVSLGTKVIVHGFVAYPDWMDQELSGTDQYQLTTQSAPFMLDVTAKYPATEITYRSSNTNVVTVDERGVVTIVGPGTATVTVSSKAVGVMRADSFQVQITVTEPELPPTEPATEPEVTTTEPENVTTEPETSEENSTQPA